MSKNWHSTQYIGWTAETSGQYTVMVERYNPSVPQHQVELVTRRRADEQERIRNAAFRILTKAYYAENDSSVTTERLVENILPVYQEAAKILRSAGDSEGEAYVLSHLGMVYESINDHDRAADYYQQALTGFRSVQDRASERFVIDRLGFLYLTTKDRALEYNRRLAEMAGEDGDLFSVAIAHNRLSGIYQSMQTTKDTAQALKLYNSALTLQHTLTERLASQSDAQSDAQPVLSSKSAEARILLKIGKTHSLLNQTAEALEIYQQALNLARESNDKLTEYNAVKMIDEIKAAKTNIKRNGI